MRNKTVKELDKMLRVQEQKNVVCELAKAWRIKTLGRTKVEVRLHNAVRQLEEIENGD